MKRGIIGTGLQGLTILIAVLIMYLGGLIFFIVSFSFYLVGGLFEWIVMNRFYSSRKRLMKKIPLSLKIANGFLWVHGIVRYIKINNTTVYDFERLGILVMFTSYTIMLIYVGLALLLFRIWGIFAFIIYLVPVLSNVIFFLENKYKIT